jgi:hypothetical protein
MHGNDLRIEKGRGYLINRPSKRAELRFRGTIFQPPELSVKGRGRNDVETFCLGELRLSVVCREKNFTLQNERAGHMEQINGPRSQAFRVRIGQLARARQGFIQLDRHLEKGATSDKMFEPGERGIALAGNVPALARR